MHRLILRRVTGATLLAFALWSPASAHCIVGARFFPATLNVDDPCVNDELSIPTIAAFADGLCESDSCSLVRLWGHGD